MTDRRLRRLHPSIRGAWRVVVAWFAILAAFACSGKTLPVGGLELLLSTDMQTPRDFDVLRLEISQETSPGNFATPLVANDFRLPTEATLPTNFAIVAGNSADQNALIRVIAKKGSTALVLREAQVQVPKDRVAELRMVISSACAGRVVIDKAGEPQPMCDNPAQSCQPDTGLCGDTIVNASGLAPYVPGDGSDAGIPTTPAVMTGGGDASPADKNSPDATTGLDAGSDAGADVTGPSSPDAGDSSNTTGSRDAGPAPSEAAAPPDGSSMCLKAGSGDYSMMGPYPVAAEAGVDLTGTGDLPDADAGPTTATLFYPSDLSDNCPHPIVSWANGTGVTGSSTYQFFNNNAASWGIVVIAADNPNAAAGANNGPYNRAGIDYLLQANNDLTSPFYHHLSTRAGVSGHSQGAFAATLATGHPNVEAEVQIEGGGTPKNGIAFLALTGSNDTVVGTMAPMSSYTSATGPSMFAEYTGADHTNTPTSNGWSQMNPGTIQFVRFYTAWWRCFLADDQVACTMFKGGASCGVCKDPNWTSLLTKNM
jgi:hypothetical protein